MNNQWTTLPSDDVIKKTTEELHHNGFSTLIVNTKEEAEEKLLSLIPPGSSVMNGTSTTLKEIGFMDYFKSEKHSYNNLHAEALKAETPEENNRLMRFSSTADYFVGSVHAITEDGTVVIASNSGSQLPAYAYAAKHVIWIVSTQKIVKNLDDAFKRIYDYVLPLESERAKKAYGVAGSFVSKILIMNREVQPDRIKIILVKDSLGF